MQVNGPSHKRKSIQKVEPEMPKRKVSSNSRSDQNRKHRTQHKAMNSPQIELAAYKRKNLIFTNQLEMTQESENKSTISKKLQYSRINRTKQSSLGTQQSRIVGSTQKRKLNKSIQKNSPQKMIENSNENNKKLKLINREQLTSRFTINHNDVEDDSLSNLIHHNKSKNSNPLINTARLKQDNKNQADLNNFGKVSIGQQTSVFQDKNHPQFSNKKSSNDQSQLGLNYNRNSNQTESFFQQRQSQQVENFQDYQFGGAHTQNQLEQSQCGNSKLKSKHRLQPPRVKSYGAGDILNKKPQNWRQMNRYVPLSESEHRMSLQIIKNQKAAIQSKRQKQQIIKLLQQFQLNKNSIHLLSQRKIQSNKIIQNFYRQRRINSQKKNSNSLPLLKTSQPKNILLIPDAQKINKEIKSFNFEPNDSMESMLRKIDQKSKVRNSLSYSKLGFGSSNPRLLNQQDLQQNELQNVRNIQKKLRQKGIQFNVDSVRKGLLNIRDGPISKISKNNFNMAQNKDFGSQDKFQVPEKQLPSNGFYKIFPL